jgi:hypothetical protein
MPKKSAKQVEKKLVDIEEIAERAERGEDVSQYFTGKQSARQRVNVDFSVILLRQIDAECERLGVTRQAWIKIACDERLRQLDSHVRHGSVS